MSGAGRTLIAIGLTLLAAGLLFSFAPKSLGWLGKLPGDISFKRGNFSFYFPLVTCILLSAVMSFIMWLFRR